MKVIYYKTDEGVRLKSTTQVFTEKAEAEKYAHDIRTYVGTGEGFDRDHKKVCGIYYVPR